MTRNIRQALSALLTAGLVLAGANPGAAEPPAVSAPPPAFAATGVDTSLLPDAKPGQCFARVREPAKYETKDQQIVTRDASHEIKIVPAEYAWVEETIVVKAASTKLVEVPAVYETKKERVDLLPASSVWREGRKASSRVADASLVATARVIGLPESADAGACFAEFRKPAKFEMREEKTLKRAAAERFEIAPAKYEWVEEKVMVKQGSEKIVQTPAVYETVTQEVIETPAHSVWKKGRGPIERVDNSTGEILCLVEVPAVTKTVRKRVLKTPAATKKVAIPAEYETVRVQKLVSPAKETRIEIPAEFQTLSRKVKVSDEATSWVAAGSKGSGQATGKVLCRAEIPATYGTVTQQVLKTPATIRKVEVPAQTKTMRVRKLVKPASEQRVEIPAKYASVTSRVKVTDEKLSWQPVLCETNTSPQLVSQIQRALKEAGLDPGPIDGVLGRQTAQAIETFQGRKGFAKGGLTFDTIAALGVKIGR